MKPLVGTSDALLDVPLEGGETVRVEAGGEGSPARPVRVGRCAHAAWSGSAAYAKACVGEDASVVPIPRAVGSNRLVGSTGPSFRPE